MTDPAVAPTMSRLPKPGFDPAIIGRKWWTEYCHPRDGDPGTRARLRRCATSTEALGIPAAVVLVRRMGVPRTLGPTQEWRLVQAINLARVLAHVKEDELTQSPMYAAGWRSFPGIARDRDGSEERPVLSELRYQRLISIESGGEEQVLGFIRLIHLLARRINVGEVANAFVYWNDRTKRNWTFEYYAAGIATPRDLQTTTEDDA